MELLVLGVVLYGVLLMIGASVIVRWNFPHSFILNIVGTIFLVAFLNPHLAFLLSFVSLTIGFAMDAHVVRRLKRQGIEPP